MKEAFLALLLIELLKFIAFLAEIESKLLHITGLVIE